MAVNSGRLLVFGSGIRSAEMMVLCLVDQMVGSMVVRSVMRTAN